MKRKKEKKETERRDTQQRCKIALAQKPEHENMDILTSMSSKL